MACFVEHGNVRSFCIKAQLNDCQVLKVDTVQWWSGAHGYCHTTNLCKDGSRKIVVGV
jgi:hypothetical protein